MVMLPSTTLATLGSIGGLLGVWKGDGMALGETEGMVAAIIAGTSQYQCDYGMFAA